MKKISALSDIVIFIGIFFQITIFTPLWMDTGRWLFAGAITLNVIALILLIIRWRNKG